MFLAVIVFGCLISFSHKNKVFNQQTGIIEATASVSVPPNYSNTAINSNVKTLTDGKLASKNPMWLDNQTLGWTYVPEIVIDLALKRKEYVESVELHTGANFNAEVLYPLNILVFIKDPLIEEYRFVGDMISDEVDLKLSSSGIYITMKNINVETSAFKIIVIPNGKFFFTDEIRVKRNDKAINDNSSYGLFKEAELQKLVNSKKQLAIDRAFERIELKSTKINNNVRSSEVIDIQEIENPWDTYFRFLSSANEINWEFESFEGFVSYKAIKLTNNSSNEKTIEISTENINGIELNYFQVDNIRTRDFKIVPDILEKILPEKLTLGAGESKILFFQIQALNKGDYVQNLTFTSVDMDLSTKIRIKTRFFANSFPKVLNVNTWAYFNYPFVIGKEKEVHKDLLNHYNNVFVIPPTILFESGLLKSSEAVKSYIKYGAGFEKVILFMNFRNLVKTNKDIILSPNWKIDFLTWYDSVVSILKDNGFSDIYLYPYDELQTSEVENYNKFVEWIREERSDAKIFVTIHRLDVINKLTVLTDICQLNDNIKTESSDYESKFKEMWLYNTDYITKSLSPYLYYRLQSWKAFYYDYSGVGFWNYADVGHKVNETSVWDDFDGNLADFSVVYDKNNDILPSRRWEAFKVGIEDNMIISLYSKRFGLEKTKKIVKKVLDNYTDTNLADITRQGMIQDLNK